MAFGYFSYKAFCLILIFMMFTAGFQKKMLDECILCLHSFSAVKHVLESIWHHINVKPAYI